MVRPPSSFCIIFSQAGVVPQAYHKTTKQIFQVTGRKTLVTRNVNWEAIKIKCRQQQNQEAQNHQDYTDILEMELVIQRWETG
jgi:hypothetical protein